jgi:type II secretory ATPase GspE/PulE/Tfp pilus assembly ATPase PilB-like protein
MLFVMLLFACLGAPEALAQSGQWPEMTLPRDFRGPGFYMSAWKILFPWVVFAFWVRTTDWANTDAQTMKLDTKLWNPVLFGSFMAAYVLHWLIPIFWVGFPLLVLVYVGSFATYVVYRNSKVDNDERVLTPEHLRYWLATHLHRVGVKIEAQARDEHEKGPPINLIGKGGPDERTDRARTLASRQMEGLRPIREIVHFGLSSRASAIMLDYTQTSVAVRHMIDGVWHNREAIEREVADPALEAMKLLSGLNPQDRQNRQEGTFGAEYNNILYNGTTATQGTKTGERVLITLVDPKVRMNTFDEIGMRTKIQEQLRELLTREKGILVFSSMPANGMRTTFDISLRHTDRLTREFLAVEEEGSRFEEIENIPVHTYKASETKNPVQLLIKLFRLDPNVVVIRDLVDQETISLICKEVKENRLFLTTNRAKDCAESLLRVLAQGAVPAEFAKTVTAAINQRLVRKLCESCKEAYTPPPPVLQQLGIPEGRIQAFYRPPTPKEDEPVCDKCGGIGYVGRTAVFEMLDVGAAVRQALANTPKLDAVRQAARKDGMRSLQEEGVLLVAKGVTSLPELMRALKQ